MTESILNPQSNALMRGIVAVGGKFKFATVERPFRAAPGEVLVRIERISINRGELTFPWAQGSAIGWDAYGTVVETSDDGKGACGWCAGRDLELFRWLGGIPCR